MSNVEVFYQLTNLYYYVTDVLLVHLKRSQYLRLITLINHTIQNLFKQLGAVRWNSFITNLSIWTNY